MFRMLIVMCLVLSFNSYGQLKVGDLAPDFEGKTLDKKDYSLSKAVEAKQITVINFWFAACPPCIKEIKHLRSLKERYKSDKNVRFIGLCIDSPKEINTLRKFIDAKEFTYEHIAYAKPIAKKFMIEAYPTNIVIGPDGKIVHISVGGGDNIEEILHQAISSIK